MGGGSALEEIEPSGRLFRLQLATERYLFLSEIPTNQVGDTQTFFGWWRRAAEELLEKKLYDVAGLSRDSDSTGKALGET